MPRQSRGYWLEQRGKTGVWLICWTEDRRKRTHSTRTNDQAAAQAYLAQFLAELAAPDVPDAPTVAEILDVYARHKEGSRAHARIAYALAPLIRHLGWLTADDLRPSHSRTYDKQRRAEGVKSGTVRRELEVLRAALGAAHDERWIPHRPAIKLPARPPAKDRWLTKDEADRLLAACVSFHVRLFVLLGLHTAARAGAILELRWSAVDMAAGLIDYGEGHGNKRRAIVPISDTLRVALVEAQQAAQTGYVVEYRGDRVRSIKRAFARAVDRAGVTPCTPHTLRHTAATWLAQAGVPMRKIALYLGHDDERTTARVYAHHSPDYLRDAAKVMDG